MKSVFLFVIICSAFCLPSIYIQSYDSVKYKWWPEVKDNNDYAGSLTHTISNFRARVTSGNVYYKIHVKGGNWSGEYRNGSNAYGKMDSLMMKVDATNVGVKYQVHVKGGNWLPWVTGYNTADSNNGYAGIIGREIDCVRAYLYDNGSVSSAQNAWFPASILSVTQLAYETYSHGNSKHIDCGSASYAFAPFTGVVRYYNRNYGVFIFISSNPVKYANGRLDNMSVMFMHGTSWYSVGTTVNQGQNLYTLGGLGSNGVTAYATHLDLGCRSGVETNPSIVGGYYSRFGNMYPYECFFVNNRRTSVWNRGSAKCSVNYGAPTNYYNLWKFINE